MQVIAGFNRVRMLTPDLAIIMEAMQGSATTELAATGLALRPRDNPSRWVLPVERRDAPAAYAQAAPAAADAAADAQQAARVAAAAPAALAPDAAAASTAKPAANSAAALQPGQGQASAAAQPQQQEQQHGRQAAAAPAEPKAADAAAAAAAGSAAGDAKAAPAAHTAEEHDDMFQLDEVRQAHILDFTFMADAKPSSVQARAPSSLQHFVQQIVQHVAL